MSNATAVKDQATLSRREKRALAATRARFRDSGDLFSERELRRLEFMRWLAQSGRMIPKSAEEAMRKEDHGGEIEG